MVDERSDSLAFDIAEEVRGNNDANKSCWTPASPIAFSWKTKTDFYLISWWVMSLLFKYLYKYINGLVEVDAVILSNMRGGGFWVEQYCLLLIVSPVMGSLRQWYFAKSSRKTWRCQRQDLSKHCHRRQPFSKLTTPCDKARSPNLLCD